mmetsp:Transcript_103791/g.317854  ORF Transcript_103791/g.317854 Transcript_103791/m.317854 type:complete len:223 (+) Transcript_103791:760-1428(+)
MRCRCPPDKRPNRSPSRIYSAGEPTGSLVSWLYIWNPAAHNKAITLSRRSAGLSRLGKRSPMTASIVLLSWINSLSAVSLDTCSTLCELPMWTRRAHTIFATSAVMVATPNTQAQCTPCISSAHRLTSEPPGMSSATVPAATAAAKPSAAATIHQPGAEAALALPPPAPWWTTRPVEGVSFRPNNKRAKVVLPSALLPTKPKHQPARSSRLTPFSTGGSPQA